MLKYLGYKAKVWGAIVSRARRRTAPVFYDSTTNSAASTPLTTFHKRSAFSGITDAFAVSYFIFYMQIMLLQNLVQGKSLTGGLRDFVPRSRSVLTSGKHYFVHNFQLYC